LSAKASTLSAQLRDRLAQVAIGVGGASELARQAKLSPSQVSRYINGRAEPSIESVAAIARCCDLSLDWLILGQGVANPDAASSITIPYFDVEASAGHGLPVDEPAAARGKLLLPSKVLGHLAARADAFFALPAKGDSMEPTIRSGTTLVARKMSDGELPGEGIHVLARSGQVFVKRLQMRAGGVVEIISDNTKYQKETMRLGDDEGTAQALRNPGVRP
jgi:transcriptional regulator with XRE-family HTH domain